MVSGVASDSTVNCTEQELKFWDATHTHTHMVSECPDIAGNEKGNEEFGYLHEKL